MDMDLLLVEGEVVVLYWLETRKEDRAGRGLEDDSCLVEERKGEV